MPRFQIFKKFPNLVYALSEKKHGSMKFLNCGKKDCRTFKNRQRFISLFGLENKNFVRAGLIHNSQVKIINQKNSKELVENVDALMTQEKNIFLSLTVADCFPVFLFDPYKQVVGIVHAGWQPIIKNIIPKTIQLMKQKIGSKPKDILIGIGPGIRKCHFEVKKDLADKILKKSDNSVICRKKDKIFIDLPLIIKKQALKKGVLSQNIEDCKKCTYCLKNSYFSYRRDKLKEIKAMMALIGLVPQRTSRYFGLFKRKIS